jgi:hypothetical protein
MKKIVTKNVLKYALGVIAVVAMITSVAAAGFDDNPSERTGITSIYRTNDCIGECGGELNIDSISIPNPGDSDNVSIFVDYKSDGISSVTSPRVKIDYPRSGTVNSATFTGLLSANDASPIQDTAILTGLPDQWKIEFVDAHIENEHGNTGTCGNNNNYEYYRDLSISDSAYWYTIPYNLDTRDEGWCSQGTYVAEYRITNTESTQQDILEVSTQSATNIGERSATLNGRLNLGNSDELWFVYSTSSSVTCTNTFRNRVLPGQRNSGSIFSLNIPSSLQESTTYYYRACAANQSNGTVSGQRLSFYTDENQGGNQTYFPTANTQREDNVTEDSAELNGDIDMNDFDNGRVFFVWGTDKSEIEDVERDHDRYSEIDEDGDDLQKEKVDDDIDSNEDRSYELYLDGLNTDENYYYIICVEYEDDRGDDTLECGNIESFRTDDEDGSDVEIATRLYRSVRNTSAELCGDLIDNGGDSSERVWIEYRESSSRSVKRTDKVRRGEGYYCEEVFNLEPSTSYSYRACADSDCGNWRRFRTSGGSISNERPIVNTLSPSSIGTRSAVLEGFYTNGGERTEVWFNWGRTQALGVKKQTYTRTGDSGAFQDSFSNLSPCTNYYYQAIAENEHGISFGNVVRFRTGGCSTTTTNNTTTRVVEVVERIQTDIDLSRLGLGLSLIRLDIDDERTTVTRGDQVSYVVTWQNISELDLADLDLQVTIPGEMRIVDSSRGRFDRDNNVIVYTIDRLDAGEDGSMIVTAVVENGNLGDVVNADATIAFNNPINDAQENATDYDIDEYVVVTNFGTASVFGLGNVTFIGWLVILLGLVIIFLIARFLYLEREELRAQVYANQMARDNTRPNVAPDNLPSDDYQPYRPNRG